MGKPKVEIGRISITLPKQMLKEIDDLIAKGHYTDRSEVIRDALRVLFRLVHNKTEKSGSESSTNSSNYR